MFSFCVMILFVTAHAETNTGNCKDMLQGYLTGQLSSSLGIFQVEALRREFKSFTDVIEKSMESFKQKITTDMERSEDARNRSVIYTRWGKKTCPSTAELVHSGYVGGSWYDQYGSAVEPLCLPRDPVWGIYRDGHDSARAYVYGAEYETYSFSDYMSTLVQHDVPCAVCLVPNRSVVEMFPARKRCYNGWKKEYHGYLMAGNYQHRAGTKYTCVDSHPDTLHGGQANKNGYLFHMVEARCGSLKCPPYVEGRELSCVVCSKE
uniref:Short-chain collagen C4-like n=1 Tax=Crassostrea virginica TaxID=6565 RepID=A0A8B8EC12_CRAVI|nr:short-chain collagen C4-like [Crassostrea virginica]